MVKQTLVVLGDDNGSIVIKIMLADTMPGINVNNTAPVVFV